MLSARMWSRLGAHLITFSPSCDCRPKAYTVWDVKSGARSTNYGSRVDFILAADGMADAEGADASRQVCPPVPCAHGVHYMHLLNHDWMGYLLFDLVLLRDLRCALFLLQETVVDKLTGADIWPECEGSDHCPVWADLNFTEELPRGHVAPALSSSFMQQGGVFSGHAAHITCN